MQVCLGGCTGTRVKMKTPNVDCPGNDGTSSP